jgi:hypothetical protein
VEKEKQPFSLDKVKTAPGSLGSKIVASDIFGDSPQTARHAVNTRYCSNIMFSAKSDIKLKIYAN